MANEKTYTAHQKFEILEYSQKYSVKDAIKKYNCTERSIYRWKKIYDGTIESLENKYRPPITPHPNAHTLKEKEIIAKKLSPFENR